MRRYGTLDWAIASLEIIFAKLWNKHFKYLT